MWGAFEPHHDEGLGVVVRGRRERKEIMKGMGLVEAGDPVKGSRNLDANAQVGKQPSDGFTYSDLQRVRENERKHRDTASVNGKLIKDLPSPKAPIKTKSII